MIKKNSAPITGHTFRFCVYCLLWLCATTRLYCVVFVITIKDDSYAIAIRTIYNLYRVYHLLDLHT